jgi:hypothetical protein
VAQRRDGVFVLAGRTSKETVKKDRQLIQMS